MKRILIGVLLALSLGVLLPAGAAPAFAGSGDFDSYGGTGER
ncbi:MAG TPA: hypothetical protein VGR25_03080 [bacterium]|nr:hypothetical protein [bacterium]